MRPRVKLYLGYVLGALFFPLFIASIVFVVKAFPEGIVLTDGLPIKETHLIVSVVLFWVALGSLVVGMNLLISSGFYRECTQEEIDREFDKSVHDMYM